MLTRKFVGVLGLAVVASVCLLEAGSARAVDVFNLGGVRDPLTGQWTGTASLEMVPVGNAGNANDPATGYGQVNYNYNIGKYDVTAGQYTAFLNAVAKTDTYGLYNSSMAPGNPNACGIVQTPITGGYSYSVDAQHQNYPVNYVSFWDSCRFTNWLQNGQPTNVGQIAGTTETGAYDLTVPNGIANNTITRSSGATWAVANENEWYKAAYYDPAKNGGAGYWLYPTRSNTAPSNVLSASGTNNANYFIDGYGYTDPMNHLTPVGTFAASPSAYGTFDEGGDVWQWNDTIISGSSRGLRGGAFNAYGDYYLQSGGRSYDDPMLESAYTPMYVGFRLSQVPEPASIGLLGLGVIGVLVRRRGAAR